MKVNTALGPKVAFAVLATLVLVLAGASPASALPGVSTPRVPPNTPWLGWLPMGDPVPDLPAVPKTPSNPITPMPRTMAESPAPNPAPVPSTPAVPSIPGTSDAKPSPQLAM